MKAIQIAKNGDADVLEIKDLPKPTPGPGEALVRLKTAGINFIDIHMRIGKKYPIPVPFIPGLEGAGIVEAVGNDVTDVKPGDRVAYCDSLGAYAEFACVKTSKLIPLPDDISFLQGAAFPLQGMTAHYILHEYYQVKKGDHVLVHAAAGGVGLLLVQWLKHLGAKVIGTVSTPEKAAIATQAGVDHIIFYTKQDFVEEVNKLTHNKGVDYIIDSVGKTTFTKDLDAIRERGHICLFGSSSGPAELLSPNSLQVKSLSIHGGRLFNFLNTKEELLMRANEVIQGIREGWLNLRIDHIFPLDKAIEAQQMLEGRNTVGKVVLNIANE